MDRVLAIRTSTLKSSLAQELEKVFRTSTLRSSVSDDLEKFFAEAPDMMETDQGKDDSADNIFYDEEQTKVNISDLQEMLTDRKHDTSSDEAATQLYVSNEATVNIFKDDETVTKLYDSDDIVGENSFDCDEDITIPLDDAVNNNVPKEDFNDCDETVQMLITKKRKNMEMISGNCNKKAKLSNV